MVSFWRDSSGNREARERKGLLREEEGEIVGKEREEEEASMVVCFYDFCTWESEAGR